MKKLEFRAYDHVYQKNYFSKDFASLAEFFSIFDNIQYTIEQINNSEDVLNLLDGMINNIKNECITLEDAIDYIECTKDALEISVMFSES